MHFLLKVENAYVQIFGDGAVRAGWLGSLIGVVSFFRSPVFAGFTSNSAATWRSISNRITYGFVTVIFSS